jgi:hypothetical protein
MNFDNKNDHYVRPNMVALKYPDFKKDGDTNVHVKMFNFSMKINEKTSQEYIINVFRYTLEDTTSEWCHNYMLEFPNYTFSKFTPTSYKCHEKT